MANEAVQAAIYKLSYDTSTFQQSADALAQGNEKVIDSFSRVEARYDPIVRAELKRQAAIQQATRFLEEGVITEDRYKQQLDRVNAAYDAQVTSASAAGQAIANNNRITEEGGIPIERLTHRFTGVAVAVGEFGAGLKSGEALIASFLRSVEFAAMSFGPWGIAIAGVTAAVGALLSNMGVFGTKAKESKDATDNLTNAQKLMASAYEATTGKINEQSNALDRYMTHANEINTAQLLIEGQKLSDLIDQQSTMAAQIKADASTGYGVSAEAQKAFDNLNANVAQQQNLVHQLAENGIIFSKQMSEAAYAAGILEDNTAATKENVKNAAGASRELKNNLQDYKDRFNEVMRGRVSFSQRLSVMSGQIEDAAKTPPAAASKQTTDAYRQQTEQTRQLEQVTSDLTQTIDGLTQSLLVNEKGSINWAQVLLQGINLVSDAIIKMASIDTGGKGGLGGLLTGLLTGIFGGGGNGSPLSNALGGGAGSVVFAGGGDFTVGGSGGTDSQMVRFMATPGEKVSVRTPLQADDSGGGVSVIYNVHVAGDADEAKIRRALAEATPGIVKASVAATQRQAGRAVTGANAWTRHA